MSAAGGPAALLGRLVVEFAQQRQVRVVHDLERARFVLAPERLRHGLDDRGDGAVVVVEGRDGHRDKTALPPLFTGERDVLDDVELTDRVGEGCVERLAVLVVEMDHRTDVVVARVAVDVDGGGDQLAGVLRLQHTSECLPVDLAQEWRVDGVAPLPVERDADGAAWHDLEHVAVTRAVDEPLELGERPVDEGMNLDGLQRFQGDPNSAFSPLGECDTSDVDAVRHFLISSHYGSSYLHVYTALMARNPCFWHILLLT